MTDEREKLQKLRIAWLKQQMKSPNPDFSNPPPNLQIDTRSQFECEFDDSPVEVKGKSYAW